MFIIEGALGKSVLFVNGTTSRNVPIYR